MKKAPIVAGVLLATAGLGVLLYPVLKDAADTQACSQQLRSLGCAMRIYENGKKRWPASLETMAKEGFTQGRRIYLCRACGEEPGETFKTHYVYVVPTGDPAQVVAYDDAPCHKGKSGRMVLFGDSSVHFVPEAELQALLAGAARVPVYSRLP